MKQKIGYFKTIFIIFCILFFGAGFAQADPCELPEFNASNFTAPMDNFFFPMPGEDGITYEYLAETEDETILNIIFVSTDTVWILGVPCTVVYDTEWVYVEELDKWFMTETTQDWHAWDNFGGFWYLGEDTTEFEYDEDWVFQDCNHDGSWRAGVDGALPGMIISADPQPGECLLQEYYEDEAEDRGKVLRIDAAVSIDFDDFEGCLVTKEWTGLEPGNVEHKFYAPGVGLVYIQELKEKTVHVELVEMYDGMPDLTGLPEAPACP